MHRKGLITDCWLRPKSIEIDWSGLGGRRSVAREEALEMGKTLSCPVLAEGPRRGCLCILREPKDLRNA